MINYKIKYERRNPLKYIDHVSSNTENIWKDLRDIVNSEKGGERLGEMKQENLL